MRLSHLAIASLLLSAPIAVAHADPYTRVHNRALFPATVTVRYAACRADHIAVPAATRSKDGTIVAGATPAPTKRHNCPIQSVSATLTGSGIAVTPFTSKGSMARAFTIVATGSTFTIYQDSEIPR